MEPTDPGQRLAAAVIRRRTELRLTQQGLADASGLGKSTIEAVERGITDRPQSKTRLGLERGLGWAAGSVTSLLAGALHVEVSEESPAEPWSADSGEDLGADAAAMSDAELRAELDILLVQRNEVLAAREQARTMAAYASQQVRAIEDRLEFLQKRLWALDAAYFERLRVDTKGTYDLAALKDPQPMADPEDDVDDHVG